MKELRLLNCNCMTPHFSSGYSRFLGYIPNGVITKQVTYIGIFPGPNKGAQLARNFCIFC